jgi:hypothetical protein
MIFQNFGFNRLKVKAAGAAPTSGFPNQALTTWTTTESAQWLSYGASVCNTTTFGYDTVTTRIGSALSGTVAKWAGGSLASNGKIYAAGHVRTDWLVIDTNNDSVTTTGNTNSNTEGTVYDKITDTVYAFGGGGAKIVCSTNAASNISGPANRSANPVQGFNGDYLYTCGFFNYSGIRIYQISTDTTTSGPSLSQGYGELGTLGSDGCMYWGNVSGGSDILKYDPVANTASTIAIGAGGNFPTLVQHYNGYIYLLPTDATSSIRKLDIATGTISAAHTMSGGFQASSACIGLDGRIYIVSSTNVGTIRWYDPTANTSGDITIGNSDTSFQGITMGAKGDLYLIPWSAALYVNKLALVTGTGTTATDIVSQYNFGGRMCWPG